ncbi:hypothetical protein B566_EDAN015758, partial [Ephemera danica]
MDQNSTAEVMEVVDPPQDKSSSASTPLQLEKLMSSMETDQNSTAEIMEAVVDPSQDKSSSASTPLQFERCGDCVQCLSCGKAVCHWGDRDDPLQVHESLSPDCPYIVTNKQTLAAMLHRQQRFRQEASARG